MFGKYTSQSVQQAAKISGQMGEELEDMLTSNVGGGTASGQGKRTPRYERYCKEIRAHLEKTGASVFAFHAGRSVASLPNFHPISDLNYKEAQEMKAKIVSLNKGRDLHIRFTSPSAATK